MYYGLIDMILMFLYEFIISSIHSLIYSFVHQSSHSFFYPLIHSFIYLPIHHIVDLILLSIYPSFYLFFVYALITHSLFPLIPIRLIFYLSFFFPPKFRQTRSHPEFVLCHWYRWILKLSCQQSNQAWWKWYSERQKHLPWPILHFNERCRLASGAQHYSNWHHSRWSQRDPPWNETVSRKNAQVNKVVLYWQKKCLFPMRTRKVMQRWKPGWFFCFQPCKMKWECQKISEQNCSLLSTTTTWMVALMQWTSHRPWYTSAE